MIFHTIHKILGKKDFTTANFLKSFFFLKFRKYSKKNKEKYRQFIFEFRKISITGEGRYKVQPIFERLTDTGLSWPLVASRFFAPETNIPDYIRLF